jgi:hypothetical protein
MTLTACEFPSTLLIAGVIFQSGAPRSMKPISICCAIYASVGRIAAKWPGTAHYVDQS